MRKKSRAGDLNSRTGRAFSYHSRSGRKPTGGGSEGYRIDWDARWRQPKAYNFAERLTLSLPAGEKLGASALSLLAPPLPVEKPAPINSNFLSSVLYHSYGVTGFKHLSSGAYGLRSAPSTGAVYSVECYPACGEVEGIGTGLYRFLPERFALERLVGEENRGRIAETLFEAGADRAELLIVFTSMFGRTSQSFGDQAYRYCLLDGGHVLGNFLAVLESLGCRTTTLGAFRDESLNKVLAIDENYEGALAVLAVGCDSQAHKSPRASVRKGEMDRIAAQGGDYYMVSPAVRRVHRSGFLRENELRAPGLPQGKSGGGAESGDYPPTVLLDEKLLDRLDAQDLGEVIAARRSIRSYSPEPLSGRDLAGALAAFSVPYFADWLIEPGKPGGLDYFEQCEVFFAANNVEGIKQGLYRYHTASGGMELLRPGDFRERTLDACGRQPFTGEAAAVIFIAPRLGRCLEGFGNRGYRYAGLHAGIMGQRLYLAATALGLGVTGVARIDDAAANRLLALDGKETTALYALTVGKPKAKQS